MIETSNIPTTARVEVAEQFCDSCSPCIKKELQRVKGIDYVRLYPKDALIVFNFIYALDLSNALNILSEIGYPEKGDRSNQEKLYRMKCQC